MSLFGREILRFRYESVRLERLMAKEYLGRGDPVAAALAAPMERSSDDDIAHLRATMMQEVVTSEINDAREFVLVDIIETYCTLSEEHAARYQRLISRKEYQRVLDTELTWADKLLLKGELKGKRETLLRQLERENLAARASRRTSRCRRFRSGNRRLAGRNSHGDRVGRSRPERLTSVPARKSC